MKAQYMQAMKNNYNIKDMKHAQHESQTYASNQSSAQDKTEPMAFFMATNGRYE